MVYRGVSVPQAGRDAYIPGVFLQPDAQGFCGKRAWVPQKLTGFDTAAVSENDLISKRGRKNLPLFYFFCILGGESESRFCYAESTGIGSRKAEWMITPYMAGAGAGVLKQAAVVQREHACLPSRKSRFDSGQRLQRLYHAVQYEHGRGTVVCPS